MKAFYYKATDIEGKVSEGTLEAPEREAVITKLQERGLIPIKVFAGEAEKAFVFPLRFGLRSGAVPMAEVVYFTRELADMLKGGVRIERALRILGEATKRKAFERVLKDVRKDVVGGSALNESLAKHPEVFKPIYVNMVKSGESGGSLPDVLARLAEYLDKAQRLRSEIISAIIYPSILTFVSGLSIVVLLVFVIPRFAAIFTDMGAALPLPTVMLLVLSSTIVSYWWLIVLLGASLVAGLILYRKTPSGAAALDAFRLRAPVAGNIYSLMEISRFSRTLGTMLKGGVPMLESISIAGEVLTSNILTLVMRDLYAEVRKGGRIGVFLREKKIIPPLVAEMVTLGEETGRLPEALLHSAETIDRHVDEKIKRLLSFLEPALVLVMGVIVGVVVISMLLAIFSVNDITF